MGHFPVAVNLITKSEVKCKVFIMKISFNSYADNLTNFHVKNCALSLALIMRFTETRKCLLGLSLPLAFPILYGILVHCSFRIRGLVSKETVVLYWWGVEKNVCLSIELIINGKLATVKRFKCCRFKH